MDGLEIQCELLIQEFKIENYERVVSIKLIQADLEIEPNQLGKDLVNILGYCSEGYETPRVWQGEWLSSNDKTSFGISSSK